MDWLIVSNLLLWGLVVFLTIVVLTLARQISLLNYHGEPKSNVIPPSMIKIGEVTREIKGIDLDGKLVEVGGPNTNNFNLVVFISPICPVSKAIATAAIFGGHFAEIRASTTGTYIASTWAVVEANP